MKLPGKVAHRDAERFVDPKLAAQQLVLVIFGEETKRRSRIDLDTEPRLRDDTAGQQQLRDRALAGAACAPQTGDAAARKPIADDPGERARLLSVGKIDRLDFRKRRVLPV